MYWTPPVPGRPHSARIPSTVTGSWGGEDKGRGEGHGTAEPGPAREGAGAEAPRVVQAVYPSRRCQRAHGSPIRNGIYNDGTGAPTPSPASETARNSRSGTSAWRSRPRGWAGPRAPARGG